MNGVVAFPASSGVDLIDQVAIAAVDFIGVGTNQGGPGGLSVGQPSRPATGPTTQGVYHTIFLMHLLDLPRVAAGSHYIVVEF